jgi:hypothetical protein
MIDNHDKHEASYQAMREAFEAGEDLLALLDRHWGDSGDDAEMILAWRDRLLVMAAHIKREIGEPRIRLPNGGLVPRPENL